MISELIEKLIAYAQIHLHMDEEDAIYKRNLLLKEFKLDAPYEGEIDRKAIEEMEVPDALMAEGKEYLVSSMGYEEKAAGREMVWVMGLLTPLPSQVNQNFAALYDVDPKLATDYLYDLGVKNNYYAKTEVDRNIGWLAEYEDGKTSLEITINLSKPEKNNKDIAKLVNAKSTSYPKCVLCHENLGFEGNDTKAARESIRFVPVTLDDEKWYLQYSPYGYYDHHCILFYEKHVPMEVSPRIISKLIAFTDLFPHFFVGSNSDLPIVGGSILNHEHFQGGAHRLPVMFSKEEYEFDVNVKGVKAVKLDFYNTVFKLTSKSKEALVEAGSKILSAWQNYDDPENSIIANDENGRHSTTTNIAEKINGEYSLYIILRNNRCDATYPDGIFHAHPEYHHIKKEGIGLIEAMGLFILPARLKRQLASVDDVVAGKVDFDKLIEEHPDMAEFKTMIEDLKKSGKTSKEYVNDVCRGILNNTAVFKNDEKGKKGLKAFLATLK
ncbi:MAG: galactose-1-phosphate uridylyltransferase [Bacilli bacterium]|nr:galactose-1-phosphate uridylyltransferase [Bacilli bacterium]